jgi:hypothetical protein
VYGIIELIAVPALSTSFERKMKLVAGAANHTRVLHAEKYRDLMTKTGVNPSHPDRVALHASVDFILRHSADAGKARAMSYGF